MTDRPGQPEPEGEQGQGGQAGQIGQTGYAGQPGGPGHEATLTALARFGEEVIGPMGEGAQ